MLNCSWEPSGYTFISSFCFCSIPLGRVSGILLCLSKKYKEVKKSVSFKVLLGFGSCSEPPESVVFGIPVFILYPFPSIKLLQSMCYNTSPSLINATYLCSRKDVLTFETWASNCLQLFLLIFSLIVLSTIVVFTFIVSFHPSKSSWRVFFFYFYLSSSLLNPFAFSVVFVYVQNNFI